MDNADINKTVSLVKAQARPGLPDDQDGVIAFLCTDDT